MPQALTFLANIWKQVPTDDLPIHFISFIPIIGSLIHLSYKHQHTPTVGQAQC